MMDKGSSAKNDLRHPLNMSADLGSDALVGNMRSKM